jgi:hypothetical protein
VDSVIAFSGTFLVALVVQTLHWLVRRRSGETRGWIAWLTSAPAWMVGWPIAVLAGAFVIIYLVIQSIATAPGH